VLFTEVVLIDSFDSSDNFLGVVECCANLESFIFQNVDNGSLILKRSNSNIATLPLLKVLDVNCAVEEEAVSGLMQCKRLESLRLYGDHSSSELISAFSSIGSKLLYLSLYIVKWLRLLSSIAQKLKGGLMRLESLIVNGKRV
jgi:hypothetical protein